MNESNENQNGDYERERVEVNKAILYAIEGFSKHTIQISIVTLVMTVFYIPILLIYYETGVRTCITETGTSIPLFILTSTIIIEVKGRIMEWVEIRRARRRAEAKEREAEILAGYRAEAKEREAEILARGKAEVINALKEAQKKGIPLEEALKNYESQNGDKEK